MGSPDEFVIIAPGDASLPACSGGGRRIDRNQTPQKSPCLRLVIIARHHTHLARNRAARLRRVLCPRLHAGSDAYPGIFGGAMMKHSEAFEKLCEDARSRVREIAVA